MLLPKRFHTDESGATAVEYAVMVALIIIVAIGAVQGLGGSNGALWGNTTSEVQTYLGPSGGGS